MDVWPLGANCSRSFCSTHLLMLTFSKKPIPMVGSWQMSVYDTKWQLSCLHLAFQLLGQFFSPSSAPWPYMFSKWRWTAAGVGGINMKVSTSPLAPSKRCQGDDVATTVSLIPMKITGWQGGWHLCLPHPPHPTHRQLQVTQAQRHVAVVCGNCKLLLKSPREWL